MDMCKNSYKPEIYITSIFFLNAYNRGRWERVTVSDSQNSLGPHGYGNIMHSY